MAKVEKLDEPFQYPLKGEYDPKSVLAPGFGIHVHGTGAVEEVEVVLSGDWASYALTHRWHPSQRAARLDDGRVAVTLQVRVCRELETWILGFGECAIVAKPHRLVEMISRRLAGGAALYGNPTKARPTIAKARRRTSERAPKRRAR